MCIMEIHDHAHRNTMVQAITHNLSTIDRDLDMLVKVGEARKDRELVDFAQNLQNMVNRAYAVGLTEFGMYVAKSVESPDGHMPHETDNHGHERSFVHVVNNATKAAKKDETR